MSLPLSMDQQVVLVTGSTRGIGFEVARTLSRAGANVILHGRDTTDVQSKVAALRTDFPQLPDGVAADLSDPKAIKAAFQSIFQKHKRLDGLVNNAGVMEDAVIGMISDDSIRRQFAINAEAVVHTTQLAARLMQKTGAGSIVNLASIMGIRGNAGQLAYSGSKAAVIGLTLAAAKELGSKQIRVNCVAPGFIETDMTKSQTPEVRERVRSNIALARLGTGSDVADVVAFLMSPLARYVTGQIIGVDGGMVV